LSKLRPLMETESEEAKQFRAEIGLLHHRLERYELHSGKGDEKKRITLSEVFLRENPPLQKSITAYGYIFVGERMTNKQMKIEVKHNKRSTLAIQHTQTVFDIAGLEALPDFQSRLTAHQQGTLRQLYAQAAPNWIENLTTHRDHDPNTREIKCGAYPFFGGKDALFAGIVEVLYQMRNTLFHGELVPTKDAIACYEPAYRLVRRFLECVS
jgi:hypothetical protein